MDRANLLQVLGALNVKVQSENRGWLNCSCPFAPWLHKGGADASPSFGAHWSDDGDTSAFFCQGCKMKGPMAFMVMKLGSLRRIDYTQLHDEVVRIEGRRASAVTMLPFDGVQADGPPADLKPLDAALYDGLYPRATEVEATMAYLATRGISPETADALGLVYRDSYPVTRQDGSTSTWWRHDILFPLYDRDGSFYGHSGRTTRADVKPKVYDKDLPKRHLILGEQRWREGYPKFLVEGLFGYAHAIEIGAEEFCDVGALMGSVMTPEKAARLIGWGDAVCLALDNDPAGDVGLYGPIDPEGRRKPDSGAVHLLVSQLVTIVPDWPSWDDEGENPKDDPDQLTVDDIHSMIFDTAPMPKPRVWKKKDLPNTRRTAKGRS